jgi:hypothetical protein
VVILGIFATVPIQGVKFARLEIDHIVCVIGLELHDVARCASGEPLIEPLLARVVPAIWAAGVVQGQNWFLIRIELFLYAAVLGSTTEALKIGVPFIGFPPKVAASTHIESRRREIERRGGK